MATLNSTSAPDTSRDSDVLDLDDPLVDQRRSGSDTTGSSDDSDGIRRRGTLLMFLLLCLGGGTAIGLIFGSDAAASYAAQDLPSWAPPAWAFGPIWAVLYTLMAISAWQVVKATGKSYRTRALVAFWVQLALNFAWTPIFFGAGEPVGAFVVIAELLVAAGWWTFEASRTKLTAGLLQLPYLAWVGIATALNAAIAF